MCGEMNKDQERQKDSIGIYGTGIFNFIEDCKDCGNYTDVDINGFCENCYIEDIEKEMKGGLNK
jgi:hypothetical protein